MDIKNIEVDGERMLVEPIESAKESKSGLILDTSTANSAEVLGKILKLGKETYEGKPIEWKIGQRVLWRRYSLDSIKFFSDEGEKKVYFVDYEDILCHTKK